MSKSVDLDLIRLFPDAGIHPAHLRYQGADGTARRVEVAMDAVSLPKADWDGYGRIVVPASYVKRRDEMRQAEEAGRSAVRVQRGRLPNHPRCPFRNKGKALFWERGYGAAWDEMKQAAWEDAA